MLRPCIVVSQSNYVCARSLEKFFLEIVRPVVALVVENFRVQIVGFFESAAARLEIRLERGNFRVSGKIIGLLKNALPFFREHKIQE